MHRLVSSISWVRIRILKVEEARILNLALDLWHSRLCRIFNSPVEHPPPRAWNPRAQFVSAICRAAGGNAILTAGSSTEQGSLPPEQKEGGVCDFESMQLGKVDPVCKPR